MDLDHLGRLPEITRKHWIGTVGFLAFDDYQTRDRLYAASRLLETGIDGEAVAAVVIMVLTG